jgi:formylglycine-generating enzyme
MIRETMTPRSVLICSVGIGVASVMIATFATAQKDAAKGELGSCAAYSGLPSDDNDTAGMVFIRSGTFVMGSERHRPEERFTHIVRVDGFWIDRHEVTNAQFREFVTATGYVTLAERGLDLATHPDMPKELLVPGSVVFIQPTNVASGGRIDSGQGQSSGRAYRLRGCARLCALARA